MAVSNSLLRLTAVLLVVSAIVCPGDGLKCYQCSSDADPNCATNPSNFADCGQLPNVGEATGGLVDIKSACLKAVVKNKENGEQVVLRNCFVTTSVMETCDIAGKISLPTNAEIIYCGTCEGDLCNGSNHVISSSLPLLLPCIVALILSYMY